MGVDIKPETPLSVLLHFHPECEVILREHFRNVDFSSITERIKTLGDISSQENADIETILEDLRNKLDA